MKHEFNIHMHSLAPRVSAEHPPALLTGGESTEHGHQLSIDWLSMTFSNQLSLQTIIIFFSELLGLPVSAVQKNGLHGYKESFTLCVGLSHDLQILGHFAFGGLNQNGTSLLQITGSGCRMITDWNHVYRFSLDNQAKFTRLDLAMDFFHGQYSITDVVQWYKEGQFTNRGRPPSSSLSGDWLNEYAGRTLYIGKTSNGKLLRVYEKGRQLGDIESPWLRFEVQIGSRDRVIPLESIIKIQDYFLGSYQCFKEHFSAFFSQSPIPISISQKQETQITVSHYLKHICNSYGQVFKYISNLADFDIQDLLNAITRFGVPRRLHQSGLKHSPQFKDAIQLMKVKIQ